MIDHYGREKPKSLPSLALTSDEIDRIVASFDKEREVDMMKPYFRAHSTMTWPSRVRKPDFSYFGGSMT